jgi:hypothetical protein
VESSARTTDSQDVTYARPKIVVNEGGQLVIRKDVKVSQTRFPVNVHWVRRCSGGLNLGCLSNSPEWIVLNLINNLTTRQCYTRYVTGSSGNPLKTPDNFPRGFWRSYLRHERPNFFN